MEHSDHVKLLRGGVPEPGGVWADLGSGTGAFTLALADLIGPSGEIYSVDKNRSALQRQEQKMRTRFPAGASAPTGRCPAVTVHCRVADYTRRLNLPPLDGAVMANSLHFQREKDAVVQLVCDYLRPGGRLILVEYDADRGNQWVPYPLSYRTWEGLAIRSGFASTTLLATVPSYFLRQIYSAVSLKK